MNYSYLGKNQYSKQNDDNTVLLIQSDTTNGSTVFSDKSWGNAIGIGTGHTINIAGNIQHSTTQAKFGNTSIAFDGNGDYLNIGDSTDWEFGSGDFTVDFWVYHTEAIGANEDYINYYTTSPNRFSWFFRRNPSGQLQVLLSSSGSSFEYNNSTTETISSNAWHHIAIVRDGNTIKPFLDGVLMTISSSYTGSLATSPEDVWIGSEDGNILHFQGFMDEIRVTKGKAIWKENFTPPVREYAPLLK